MITVKDFKGFYWNLHAGQYRTSRQGLVELKMFCSSPAPMELRGYGMIPVPVFTEWWA